MMADINGANDGILNGSMDNSEYKVHTQKYTDLLSNYVAHTESSNEIKNAYKKIFFWTILGIMFVLTFLFVSSISNAFDLIEKLSKDKTAQIGNVAGIITAVISSFVTMLASLFKLPKIIAEYLFNPKEDKNMSTIVGQIQQYDIGMYSVERGLELEMMRQGGDVSERDSAPVSDEYPGNPDDMVINTNAASESG